MRQVDYKVLLQPDPDGGYVVFCPVLPGCYSQGDSIQEALLNIKEAIELCIEDMKEHHEAIPDSSATLIGSVLVEQ